MSDPTFRLEPTPAPPPAGVSASGLQPPPPPTRGAIVTAPRAMYAVGFVFAAALLWIRFNPTFGVQDFGGRMTPLQAFQGVDGFSWSPAQRAIGFLVLMMLGYLAVTLARAGRRRGAAALVLALFAFISRGPTPDYLDKMLLFIAAAGMCGAIFVPRERATTWTRRAFWMSFVVLTGVLWMPHGAEQMQELRYVSTGTELIGNYANPPEESFTGEALEGVGERYGQLFAAQLPETAGLLLWVVGFLIAIGMQAAWLRILATAFLILLVFGSSAAWAVNAAMQRIHGDLTPLQNALYGLGDIWYTQFIAFTWPMAGAVREATGG